MLTPKEILNKALYEYLIDKFSNEGFKYLDKSTKFTKKNEVGFTYEVNFLGSKTNWLNEYVNFKVQYLIYSANYKSWHIKNFPNQPILGGGYLQGNRHIQCEESGINQNGFGYDFVKFEPQNIMLEIWNNYLNHGRRYFESGSEWEGIHKNATSVNLRIDSLIFQKKLENAINYVNTTLDKYLESYVTEENIPLNSEQNYEIFKSRKIYLEKEYGL